MYSIIDIYEQALLHRPSKGAESDEQHFCMYKGIKIQMDKLTKLIKIFNTTKGGDYYQELTREVYKLFQDNGWLCGVLLVSLNNYKRKLNIINTQIQLTLNKDTSSERHYKKLKESRSRYLTLYNRTTKQLNQLQCLN